MKRWCLLVGLVLVPALAGLVLAGQAQQHGGNRIALLVGATRYDHLSEKVQLAGPGNDVKLMRKVLIERFGFKADNIVTLSEEVAKEKGVNYRPLRANIKREFQTLAKAAQKGDTVYIHLSGHGSQQPDQPPGVSERDEEDGMDEVYLPADADSLDTGRAIKNAIIDDELKHWTKAITDKGASVFLVCDCCHSGTLLRDVGGEVAREVRPEDKGVLAGANRRDQSLVSPAAVQEAINLAKKKPPISAGKGAFDNLGQGVDLVALYAAQPIEPTYERPMPPDGTHRVQHGLFTFTICMILTEAQHPLTCRELLQQVQARYTAWSRWYPTPLIEGSNLDREFLGKGSWKDRSRFILSQTNHGKWTVNAGQLHGLGEESVLAVYPPAGQPAADKVAGHVKILRSQLYESFVEPCAHEKSPKVDKLPLGGRCEPVQVDAGLLKMRLAIDSGQDLPKERQPASDEVKALQEALKKVEAQPEAMTELVADPSAATWVAQVSKGQVYLLPADAALLQREQTRNISATQGQKPFGPFRVDQPVPLAEQLSQIARAQNLMRLAGTGKGEVARSTGGLNIKLEVVASRKGKPLPASQADMILQAGDEVFFRVTNKGRESVDVTLLFVDSKFKIEPLFPNRPGVNNRLFADNAYESEMFTVDENTTGLEHLILIAVKGEKQNRDFAWLAQPGLPQAELKRGKQEGPSGLTALLNHALYREGTQRGLTRQAAANYDLRMMSWRVQPATK